MEQENWLPVTYPTFSDLYQVSNLGRVRRSAAGRAGTYAGRLLNPVPNAYGRLVVNLTDADGHQKVLYVHHLVALAFIGAPPGPIGSKPNTFQINHKDGLPTNNCVENLEWCSPQENIRHAVSTGLMKAVCGEDSGHAVLTESIVIQARQRFAAGEKSNALASEFKISNGAMMSAIHGLTWKHLPGVVAPGTRQVLNAEMVREARTRAAAGETIKSIARSMECEYYTLYSAVRRRNWKHI